MDGKGIFSNSTVPLYSLDSAHSFMVNQASVIVPIMEPINGEQTDLPLKKKKQKSVQVCYLLLQLLHKLNRVGERLLLVTSQRLQVQDGLIALSLQDSDGLQQPLVAETE